MNKNLDTDRLREVRKVLEGSTDDLLVLIGFHADPDLGAFPPSAAELASKGRAWLRERREALARSVCGNAAIMRAVQRGDSPADLVIVICDALIMENSLMQVPVLFISAWIVKRGVEQFCVDSGVEP